jgi:hypothetical protein
MSWDGLIMNLGNVKSIGDLPKDFQPPPIGTSELVASALRRMFPDAEHYEGMSSLQGEDFWLELAHGCHTDAAGMVSAVGVRSNAGSGSLEPIRRVCDEFGARLFDCQMGELADLAEGTEESMKTFAEWRDGVLSRPGWQD